MQTRREGDESTPWTIYSYVPTPEGTLRWRAGGGDIPPWICLTLRGETRKVWGGKLTHMPAVPDVIIFRH